MNAAGTEKPLSGFLKGMVKAGIMDPETAAVANRLPTAGLQEQAIDMFRQERPVVMNQIVTRLLERASGPIINESLSENKQSAPLGTVPTSEREVAIPGVLRTGGTGGAGGTLRQVWAATIERLGWWKWLIALWLISTLGSAIWKMISSPLHTPALLPPTSVEYSPPPMPAQRPKAPLRSEAKPPPPSLPVGVPIPTEVHIETRSPDDIRISWKSVGEGHRYNVYSSPSRLLTDLRKENDEPLKSSIAIWTPETDFERSWVVVTALDDQGRESAYSEAVEAIRYPARTR
jgi:hypothetical protein